MQIRQILEKHASEPLLITGEDYPASAEKQQLASVISMIQMILISLLIAGNAIFSAIGIPTPQLVRKLQESPWMYGFLYLLSETISRRVCAKLEPSRSRSTGSSYGANCRHTKCRLYLSSNRDLKSSESSSCEVAALPQLFHKTEGLRVYDAGQSNPD